MRDSTILIGLSLASIFVGGYLIFYGHTVTPSGAAVATTDSVAATVSFVKLADGQDAGVHERVNYLLVAPDQLDSLWKEIGASSTEPFVDFKKDTVLAVFAGTEPTAGYGIGVSGIEDQAGVRTVHISIQMPGSGCMAAETITHPFELVTVPKSSVPVELAHTYATSTVPCQ